MKGRVEENYTRKIAGLAALLFFFAGTPQADVVHAAIPFSIYNTETLVIGQRYSVARR
jgi:hypothetical protein